MTLKTAETTHEEIQTTKNVVADYVHICRSDFFDLTYQLNAEMYITGLRRTRRSRSQSHGLKTGAILMCTRIFSEEKPITEHRPIKVTSSNLLQHIS